MRWFCFVRHISTSMQLMQVIHMINKSRRYSSYTSRHKNNWHEIIRHNALFVLLHVNYKTYNTLQLLDLHKQVIFLFINMYIILRSCLKFLLLINSLSSMKRFIIHDYNIRNKSNMHIYSSKNSAGLRTIRHKAAVLWNELPVSLQEINSLSVFKNKLKQYLLLSY